MEKDKCEYCGNKEVVHYPVISFFGESIPLCAYCFHGASMKYSAEQGCMECIEALEKEKV